MAASPPDTNGVNARRTIYMISFATGPSGQILHIVHHPAQRSIEALVAVSLQVRRFHVLRVPPAKNLKRN